MAARKLSRCRDCTPMRAVHRGRTATAASGDRTEYARGPVGPRRVPRRSGRRPCSCARPSGVEDGRRPVAGGADDGRARAPGAGARAADAGRRRGGARRAHRVARRRRRCGPATAGSRWPAPRTLRIRRGGGRHHRRGLERSGRSARPEPAMRASRAAGRRASSPRSTGLGRARASSTARSTIRARAGCGAACSCPSSPARSRPARSARSPRPTSATGSRASSTADDACSSTRTSPCTSLRPAVGRVDRDGRRAATTAPTGAGMSDTALYDPGGRIGRVVQSLLVAPRG